MMPSATSAPGLGSAILQRGFDLVCRVKRMLSGRRIHCEADNATRRYLAESSDAADACNGGVRREFEAIGMVGVSWRNNDDGTLPN